MIEAKKIATDHWTGKLPTFLVIFPHEYAENPNLIFPKLGDLPVVAEMQKLPDSDLKIRPIFRAPYILFTVWERGKFAWSQVSRTVTESYKVIENSLNPEQQHKIFLKLVYKAF